MLGEQIPMTGVRIERARKKGYDDGYAVCNWRLKEFGVVDDKGELIPVAVRFRMNVNGIVTCEHGVKCPGARSESPDCKLADIIAGVRKKIHQQNRDKMSRMRGLISRIAENETVKKK